MLTLVHVASPSATSTGRLLTTAAIEQEREWFPLSREWNELLSNSTSDSLFLTWEWLDAWWTHLSGADRLQVIAVRDGDLLVAVAPLRGTNDRLRPFARSAFLGTGAAGSDYLDLIIRRGYEEAALTAIAGALERKPQSLQFDHLPPQPLASGLMPHLTAAGWTARESTREFCPFIPLEGHTWDSYLATRGSAHRANVRRRLRGLDKDFRVSFQPVADYTRRRQALAQLIWFHEQRFAGKGGSSAFGTPALCAFHDDATKRMLESGWLRLFELQLDDRCVAVMYGFFYGRRFYFYQHGFDAEFARFGVGLALMAMTIRAAIEEGAIEFDMLYGREEYKHLWTSEQRPLGQLDLYPPDLGGRLCRRAVEMRQALGALRHRVNL
jgi:CelD/BcsL family acetyltransferase involved in cellulose biosynthesis